MSSPISKSKKSLFDSLLIYLHQRLSHRTRVAILADKFVSLIKDNAPGQEVIKCLDIGCGDMVIAEMIQQKCASVQFKCADIYPVPEQLKGDPRWDKYVCFDGQSLPFDDTTFDFVIFCDVLHHTTDESQRKLFREAARVSKHVIVKDHFQYGFYSRNVIRFFDRLGNSAYGVEVPSNYFSEESFAKLCGECSLTPIQWIRGITLYAHLPFLYLVMRRSWEFMAVLSSKAAK
jgi:SAM-dependent methyltransferase